MCLPIPHTFICQSCSSNGQLGPTLLLIKRMFPRQVFNARTTAAMRAQLPKSAWKVCTIKNQARVGRALAFNTSLVLLVLGTCS